MPQPDDDTPLEFPLRFPIKAMGPAEDSFQSLVVEIVRRHVSDFDDAEIHHRDSRNGRFRSVTVTFTATSRAQLDDLYRELTSHESIVYVL